LRSKYCIEKTCRNETRLTGILTREAIQMEPMISHRMTIDEWLPTFKAIERCEGVKAIMLFNQGKK